MDKRHDESRHFLRSAVRAVLGGLALIAVAVATAAGMSLFIFMAALFAVPFLPQLIVAGGSLVVLLILVNWFYGGISRESSAKPTFDRKSRDLLVDSIRRYLSDKITAFEFDDEIFKISADSADPAVKQAVSGLWFLYDDVKDHHVVLSKEGWDYCQRLILLLESDAQIEIQQRKRWSFNQLVAGMALSAFIGYAAATGFGKHWLVMVVPFGVLSIGLSRFPGKDKPDEAIPESTALTPFSTVSEILKVCRRTPGFKKQKFPPSLATRRIRPTAAKFDSGWLIYAYWLFFSPVVLLWQTLPETETRTRVVVP